MSTPEGDSTPIDPIRELQIDAEIHEGKHDLPVLEEVPASQLIQKPIANPLSRLLKATPEDYLRSWEKDVAKRERLKSPTLQKTIREAFRSTE